MHFIVYNCTSVKNKKNHTLEHRKGIANLLLETESRLFCAEKNGLFFFQVESEEIARMNKVEDKEECSRQRKQ